MTAPAGAHRTTVRYHPTAPTSTWSCTCGTDEGAKPQSSPFATARAAAHEGRPYVPEPWQDYGDARDAGRADDADALAQARSDNPSPVRSHR